MHKLTVKFAILGFLITLFPGFSFARDIGFAEDPSKIGVGARPMGMGKAFVAIADDENAIFLNPAGISNLKKWSFTSMYSSFLQDVNYLTAVFSRPLPALKNGGCAIGYLGSNVPGIISPGQTGFTYSDYNNNVWILGAGFAPRKELSLGLGLKLFQQGFSGTINSSGSGLDLDLGAKWELDPRLVVGLNLQNILPASLGGKVSWPNGDYQRIPAVAKVGIKGLTPDHKVTLALDYDLQMERGLPATAHVGGEWEFHPALSLRGGFDQNASAATGSVVTNLTLGLGLKIGILKFDYAYHPYFEEAGNLTHFFSVSFSGPTPLPPTALIPTVEAIPIPTPPVPAPPTRRPAREPALEAPTAPVPTPLVYKVAAGDCLEKIALKFFNDPSAVFDIAAYNKLDNPNLIYIGQELAVPPLEIKIFKDVTAGTYGFKEIQYLGKTGIIVGYPDRTFRPKNIIKRAEFISLLMRATQTGLENNLRLQNSFPDVPASHWAADYIHQAKRKGYVAGYPDGEFKPGRSISMSEANAILYKLKGRDGIKDTTRAGVAKFIAGKLKKK